jgi:hypothetical protein
MKLISIFQLLQTRQVQYSLCSLLLLICMQFSRSVVRKCLAFEPREDQRTVNIDGITVIPREGDVDIYLEKFIIEFGQQLLSAFNIMVS